MSDVKRLALAVLILFVPTSALAQETGPALKPDKIKEFINRLTIEHNKREKQGGIPVEFTREFVVLPQALEESLQSAFPDHKFTVAKFLYFHWTWYPGLNLFIVTDKHSGEVVSYAWDIWFIKVSDSFRDFLSTYPARSETDALSKVKALSDLLVFPGNGRVGKVENRNGIISSELYVQIDWPGRVLQVSLDREFRFGRMSFINPKDGMAASKTLQTEMPDISR